MADGSVGSAWSGLPAEALEFGQPCVYLILGERPDLPLLLVLRKDLHAIEMERLCLAEGVGHRTGD